MLAMTPTNEAGLKPPTEGPRPVFRNIPHLREDFVSVNKDRPELSEQGQCSESVLIKLVLIAFLK